MSRNTILRIIVALCTAMLLVSSCAIALAEYENQIVITIPAGKNAYGPSKGYVKRPVGTTSTDWRCYLEQLVYTDCECEYDKGGVSVYVYCRNKVTAAVASDTVPMDMFGGYNDNRDAHPFRHSVASALNNPLTEYKLVAVRNNCGAVDNQDEIAALFSWQPY